MAVIDRKIAMLPTRTGRADVMHYRIRNQQDRMAGLSRNKVNMPGSLAYGGGYLWVREFKFSTRILRFSPVE